MNTTEQSSNYDNLESMSTLDLLEGMNAEDKLVPIAVEKSIPQIEKLVDAVVEKMRAGGRLFYIGAGTSGRLGIVDASECPPTFGVDHGLVNGIIAGGDKAIRKAVENAEDNESQAWNDLREFSIEENDCVIGIAASGGTPYVIGGLNEARSKGLTTGCIVCNKGSKVADACEFPVEVVVGPEFVTGSTRMKSGTAQKLVLNMLSTSIMIKLGKVKGNKMVDMQLSNEKLVDRGTRMIMNETDLDYQTAQKMLLELGSVRKVIDQYGLE
ncbi:N-acetylmuramic acid 6-phosphate etherase [Aureibacter tunicatorum]|uniref:N-acetylmuramic acid 6-phosphate etherase n=1 Tax=Aureibacter tunicatorum TaxID=866807 RepID=A0AAE3XLF2_9BACT|nr:N-acetylmuramic acid 6-phosphate etherase [Aureibacter tunicatorum]MDR6237109.1 N-acetylmuramic acid 6-phosphate etherase [Aureibacter tunicatorum]BDD06101.1 N-acetylmuramic acid 6-phosphate etherase [Aureibacter tunicatorum]